MASWAEIAWALLAASGASLSFGMIWLAITDRARVRRSGVNGATLLMANARIRGETFRFSCQVLCLIGALIQLDSAPVVGRLGPTHSPAIGIVSQTIGLGPSSQVILILTVLLSVWTWTVYTDRRRVLAILEKEGIG